MARSSQIPAAQARARCPVGRAPRPPRRSSLLAALLVCVLAGSLAAITQSAAAKRATHRKHAHSSCHVKRRSAHRRHRRSSCHARTPVHHKHRHKSPRGSASAHKAALLAARSIASAAPLESGRTVPVAAALAPLVFGVYPGGAAGTVSSTGPPQPEDPVKRLSALEQLRPQGKPFVLRLYASYSGPGSPPAATQLGQEIAQYTASGFQIEVVLCYRPADENPSVDVPGFVDFVRGTVDQLGSNPGVVSLQVTNEANVQGAPNAADGYYAGAEDALIGGVEGAKAEIDRGGFDQLKVGFNWAYQLDGAENAFWSYLGEHGGSAFLRALDWVGIDAYPGTWGPQLSANLDFSDGVRQATVEALSSLRDTYMPLAGIGASVPIHVCESGYPTGPGRSYAQQSTALQQAVEAVSANRATYNVSDYRWFDLRDANSSSTSFEDQYGLMSDTYTPKPAFAVYHALATTL